MATKYEADKIIQLLQFCSWLGRTEMNHTGLHELSGRLNPKASKNGPNEKYLVDLLSDARTALKKDNFVFKRNSYIELLLNHVGFKDWDDWIEVLNSSNGYISKQHLESTVIADLKIVVFIPEDLAKKLTPVLSHVKRSSAIQFNIAISKEETIQEQVEHLQTKLKDCSFIIWVLPLLWKDQPNQLASPSWAELMQLGRIVPVWIDPNKIDETAPPFISGLDQSKIVGGVPGILTSLLFLEEQLTVDPLSPETESTMKKSSGNIQNINNGPGVFLQGNIYSENTSLGDIHQTIHNYKREDK